MQCYSTYNWSLRHFLPQNEVPVPPPLPRDGQHHLTEVAGCGDGRQTKAQAHQQPATEGLALAPFGVENQEWKPKCWAWVGSNLEKELNKAANASLKSLGKTDISPKKTPLGEFPHLPKAASSENQQGSWKAWDLLLAARVLFPLEFRKELEIQYPT